MVQQGDFPVIEVLSSGLDLWSIVRAAGMLMLISLYACSDSPPTTPVDDGDDGEPPTDPTSAFECERAGFPCTLGEVNPSVRERGWELAEEIEPRIQGRSTASAVAWLQQQDGVVEAAGENGVIRFRLEGGRYVWVLGETALRPPGANASARHSAPGSRTHDVTGRDRNDDDEVNNRDERRALVLAPYNYYLGDGDEALLVSSELRFTHGYSPERVDLMLDDEADLETFRNWDDYDVVHVSTHGGRICQGEICYISISTGERYNAARHGNVVGVHDVGHRDENGVWRRYVGLDADFFAKQYPDGLDRTLVVFSGCSTAPPADDDVSTIDVASALTSPSRSMMYLGWTNTVETGDRLIDAFVHIYERMNKDGLSIGHAMQSAKAAGLLPLPSEDGEVADLSAYGFRDLHIREVVALLDLHGDTLRDGADITHMIKGAPNDDQPDILRLAAVVDGVPTDDHASEFAVQFRLDREPVGDPVSLSRAEKVRDHVYRLSAEVPAGKDIRSDREYMLDAVVQLPPSDEGDSRYEAAELGVRGCFWEVTFAGGPRAGTYSDSVAYFDRRSGPGAELSIVLPPLSDVATLIGVSEAPAPGALGSFTLGQNETGDGGAWISFFDGNPAYANFNTGDGSEERDEDGRVIFEYPEPSTLTLTWHSEHRLEGRVEGELWSLDITRPSANTYVTTPVSLRFEALLFNPNRDDPLKDPCRS